MYDLGWLWMAWMFIIRNSIGCGQCLRPKMLSDIFSFSFTLLLPNWLSISIRIYSGIARFPCDSMAFLLLCEITWNLTNLVSNSGVKGHRGSWCLLALSLSRENRTMLFTLFQVNLILRISLHQSHQLHSHHLSLHQSFTPDLKLISFTNPFLHSLLILFRTAFTALESVLN